MFLQCRKAEEEEFAVSGAMIDATWIRNYEIVWPEDGKRSKENKSGLMHFQGCETIVLTNSVSAISTWSSLSKKLEKEET